MATLAEQKGFSVLYEEALGYYPAKGFFRLNAYTSRDIRDERGLTTVFFDAQSGKLLGSSIPTGEASGDTITTWLLTLHTAQIWGIPFRIFMTLLGLAVAMLSATGVIIWWKKRKARVIAGNRRSVHDITQLVPHSRL